MNAVPGPRGPLQSLSCLRRIMANYAEAYEWLYTHHGPVASFRRPFPAIVFFEPKDFAHILKKNAQNYVKSHHYEILRRFLGEGLVTSEGETWRTHRRLMAPEFHLSRVMDFSEIIHRRTQDLEAVWERAAETGEVRNLLADLSELTLFIVGEALFGTDTDAFSKEISENLETGLETTLAEMVLPFRVPKWMPTVGRYRSRRASERLNAIIKKVIDLRKNEPGQENLMARLLKAFNTGQPKLSKEALVDEMKTLILAGHETTALALLWTFYLLAKNPAVRDKLSRAEDSYVTWVVQESMRLRPPVPAVSRVALQEDEIAGYRVPPGQLVVVAPFVTHRLPHVWKDPLAFRPERFENPSPAEKDAYIPFVYGPRGCIGEHFAMLEAQIILGRLGRKFAVDLVDSRDVGTRPLSTLRPDRDVWVKIRKV